jgi:RNA polymerase sigma-70 factor (sigma-E family)
VTDAAEDFHAYVYARYRALMRTAYLLTGEHHAAEDLVQTSLAKAYLAWTRIERQEAVDSYVRRTMVNEHTSWWRRAWRRREESRSQVPDLPTEDVGERDRDLWDLVKRLPTKQRVAVVLRYYEDLTEAETAEALGVSVSAVKSRTSRAIASLRSVLSDSVESSVERTVR